MKPDEIALTVLALAEVPQVMSAFEPSPFTMATFAHDPAARAYVRREYIVGGAVSLAIAGAAASLVGSWLPFFGAAAVLAITLYEYERALNNASYSGRDMTAAAAPARAFSNGHRAARYRLSD